MQKLTPAEKTIAVFIAKRAAISLAAGIAIGAAITLIDRINIAAAEEE
jgi:hypothetical protein